MNITHREAEVIRSALATLIDDSNQEYYAGVLEKLALSPSVIQLCDMEGFMNGIVYSSDAPK
ncbi:hypothetical protein [Guptibacillus sedimenti]|uniref:hypothetical protein n=1 Tax=Guptibacillus sedimenti TaxID=3025680 RepID=UPI00235E2E3A|nr:hypothetical protein [Pseudalkalibacillus sedimenti]